MSQSVIHPDLKRVIDEAESDQEIPVIVRYRREPGVVEAQRMAGNLSLVTSYEKVPAVAAEGTAEDIIALAEDPRVERIWYDLPVHTMLDVSVPLIGAVQVWAESGQGQGIKVGILDTGCDLQHDDLKDRIVKNEDFTGKGSAQDGNGHGTHVAGIIAGSGAASNGRYKGVAPAADLYIAKVLDDGGNGRTSTVISGLEWAIDQGAQVVNLSLGSDGSCDGTDALSEACDAAVGLGVVVVVAAGNSGPGSRTVGAPGCAREVITIGASTDEDDVADYSSRGPTLDGRVKPDLVFPGSGIISARAAGTSLGRVIDDQYTELSGTSMATPHASGVAALLLEAEPDLTPVQLKDRLKSTAIDLELNANTQGTGRGDALAALHAGDQEPAPTPTPEPTPEPTPTPEPPPGAGGCLLPVSFLFRLFH